MNRPTMALFTCTSLMLLPTAQAAFFNNAAGLAMPGQTLSFEGLVQPANTAITNQFEGQGVQFANATWNPDEQGGYANIVGNRIGNFFAGIPQTGLFSMTFTSPLSAVGFALVTAQGGLTTFSARLSGNLVETMTVPTTFDNAVNYFGFSGIVFDEVTVSVVSVDRAFLLDSLQTTVVPEPSSWALAIAGAGVGLVLSRARRHRRS